MSILDAFIRDLKNPRIRERLLENASISLEKAYDQARALELAEHHSASYLISSSAPVAVAEQCENKNDDSEQLAVVAPIRSRKCFFCGRDLHLRIICPAKDPICQGCGKNGHYQKVCKSKLLRSTTNSTAAVYTLASA
ncbi:uncharacterized protein LOC118192189 [Stegodyphus dumicola]|uniref:uncharacterized protein LOC118192189 n=1 Tax=Stegodyphus dumicola TaxID=202533 RepID=UPI0015B2DCBC|nr:uncharacterized protein LOC118192189 [Stegodyphus dumicola]